MFPPQEVVKEANKTWVDIQLSQILGQRWRISNKSKDKIIPKFTLKRTRQQVSDKHISEEANEFKFKQYVSRVNDAVRRIHHERKEIMKKNVNNMMTIEQVFGTPQRPMTAGASSLMLQQSTKNQGNKLNSLQAPPNAQSQAVIKTQKSMIAGKSLIQQNPANSTPQNNTLIDPNQYQLQLIKSQGQMQIQKEQNELKQFLTREKQKTKMLKNFEKRFQKVEEKQQEKMKMLKEIAKIKEDKRMQKTLQFKQRELDNQRSLERLNQSKFNRSFDRSQQQNTMISQFRQSANQIQIQQRIEQSKQKRISMDKEIDKKIEQEKRFYIEKCKLMTEQTSIELRSAINHELVLDDIVSNLKDKTSTCNLDKNYNRYVVQQKHDWVKSKENDIDLQNEVKYLSKTEAIHKRREEQEKRFQEKMKKLHDQHSIKRDRFESHKKEQLTRMRSLAAKQMQLEKDKYSTMNTLALRGALDFKSTESFMKQDRNLHSANKEKNQLKREMVEENQDREKRKLEWKKLTILAKEQLYQDKIKMQRDQQRQLLSSQKIVSTIVQVKAAPFSPTAKRLIERTLPPSAGKDLLEIYRDSSEERKKKKDEDKNNF
ncbi:UNKNOWN [Stylonychia lemnae]|uniref:Uncharacterized protein n=1 Tax=Stylonychia lemnae TaxID=5949 RepID=A0A078AQW1_STYLE|nr:UNKNOWN [Stylonychia lemnae]|eukprot:CDW83627.1 UNKNOWN [Stylonychia lemnae]